MEKEKSARKKANAFPALFNISLTLKKFVSCAPIFFAFYFYILILFVFPFIEEYDLAFAHIFIT